MLENFDSVRLNHGLMEFGYMMNHQNLLSDPTSAVTDDQELSVSMTATMDFMGNLVLGKIKNSCAHLLYLSVHGRFSNCWDR